MPNRFTKFVNKLPVVGKVFASFGDNFPTAGIISSWNDPQAITRRTFLSQNVGYVWTCVRAIADEVGRINLKVVKADRNGNPKEIGHPFIRLLRKPNPYSSQFTLFQLTTAFRKLTGECFWYSRVGETSRKPREIYLLRPDLVQVINGEDGYIKGYVYNLPSGEKVPLDLDEVLPLLLPNPEDPTRGYGVVQAAGLYIQTEEYASRFGRNFLFNSGRPSGGLSVPNMNEEDFNQLKEKWRSEYGTVDNAGKVAIVRDTEVKFEQLGEGMNNIAIKAAKEMSRDDIVAMFRVPKPIVGFTQDLNRATAESAEYVFAKRVIDPEMYAIADAIETYIDKTYGDPDIDVIYDSPVPEDKTANLAENTASLNSWKTINEIRAEKGLTPITNGDQLYQPFNLAQRGEPIKEQKSVGVIKIRRKRLIVKENKRELAKEVKENFRVTLMKTQEQFSKLLQAKIDKFIGNQEREVLSRLKPRKMMAKAFNEILFDIDQEVKDMVEDVFPILVELAKEQGSIALLLAGEEELKFEITQRISDTIRSRAARMGINFNTETRQALEKILTDAALNDQTLAETTKKIRSVYLDGKKFRAERVARTETLQASTDAAIEAYRQTGYVIKKEWLANPTACEFCQAMQGRVLGIETVYFEAGQTLTGVDGGIRVFDYDTVNGPPPHPNCTCTVIPVVE